MGWSGNARTRKRGTHPDSRLLLCSSEKIECGPDPDHDWRLDATEVRCHSQFLLRRAQSKLLKQRLTRDYPGLRVAGTLTPPFRSLTAEEDAATTAHINVVKPDIVWIRDAVIAAVVELAVPAGSRELAHGAHEVGAAGAIETEAARHPHERHAVGRDQPGLVMNPPQPGISQAFYDV
jgi:hypothetical protein